PAESVMCTREFETLKTPSVPGSNTATIWDSSKTLAAFVGNRRFPTSVDQSHIVLDGIRSREMSAALSGNAPPSAVIVYGVCPAASLPTKCRLPFDISATQFEPLRRYQPTTTIGIRTLAIELPKTEGRADSRIEAVLPDV